MGADEQRRRRIREVSEALDLPSHVLRQWEDKIPQLKPKCDSAGLRYYVEADLDILRRIKYFIRHEKMTIEGARLRLAQELHGPGRPQTQREHIDLVDKMEAEIRTMFDLLDSV